jgi:hypothetical protein
MRFRRPLQLTAELQDDARLFNTYFGVGLRLLEFSVWTAVDESPGGSCHCA